MTPTQCSAILFWCVDCSGGFVCGVVDPLLYPGSPEPATSRKSPEDYRRGYVEELRVRLNLNAEQLLKLNGVLDQTRAQYKDVRDRMKPDMNRIKSEQIEKINSLLSTDQQQKYETFRKDQSNATKGSPPGF